LAEPTHFAQQRGCNRWRAADLQVAPTTVVVAPSPDYPLFTQVQILSMRRWTLHWKSQRKVAASALKKIEKKNLKLM